MNIVFAGTPDFARAFLQDILDCARHRVVAVYTQPDRPSGRGKQLQASLVKELAVAHQIPICQPLSLRDSAAQQALAALAPDLMVVVAYGLILPQAVLDIPTHGCINVHASLLPRWRGAAPIQRAVGAGDRHSGISLMRMEAGLDTGPVLAEASLELDPRETAGSLHDRLINLGLPLLRDVLDRIPSIYASARVQDEAQASYANKITPADACIDWSRPAAEIERQVRAMQPVPGAYTWLGRERIKIWRAHAEPGAAAPGQLVHQGPQAIAVGCGEGLLVLEEVQLPSKRAMAIAELLRGHSGLFAPGTWLRVASV